MPKKITTQKIKSAEQNSPARETKILNVICNISLLLMSTVTETFSEMFTNLLKEMITALTTCLDDSEDATKDIHKKKQIVCKKNSLDKYESSCLR